MVCDRCGLEVADSTTVCPNCSAQLPGKPVLSVGTRLGLEGRYAVGKVLGQGEYGITYQGSDSKLEKVVAIKEMFIEGCTRGPRGVVVPASGSADAQKKARNRFLQEAKNLAMFDHPGIVKVLDTFEENQTAYIVMELLRGQTLGALLAEKKLFEPGEGRKVMEMVMNALEAIHQKGILHRDIKPANLMWVNGRVVLVDFGFARTYEVGQIQTLSRTFLTEAYAPPEQYSNREAFGPYTDLYALGATVYHLLSGKKPPTYTDRAAGKHFDPLPEGVAPRMVTAIERCLELNYRNRVQSVAELRAILDD
jgi:serine/threonine protein kinase